MGTSVLVVDDDEEFRAAMCDVLRAEGCDVVEADDGEVALEMLDRVTPDLIVVDLVMPRMSGWELLAAIDGREELRGVAIAIFSGAPERTTLPRALNVFQKPVDLPNLLGLLAVLPQASA